MHDHAQVFVNGRLVGILDRRFEEDRLVIDIPSGATPDILAGNWGRVNIRMKLRTERNDITHPVTLSGALTVW